MAAHRLTTALAFAVAALVWGGVAGAGTFDFAFAADPDSRFFDFTSDAFAQIDQGYNGDQERDGFFFFQAEFGNPSSPVVFTSEADFDAFSPSLFQQIPGDENENGADVFPRETAFSDFEKLLGDVDIGRLDFDDTTGQITFVDVDFVEYAAPDHSPFNEAQGGRQGYLTVLLDPLGPDDRVTLKNGVVTGIELSTGIRFDYDIQGTIVEGFVGEFRISGDRFDLFINDTAGLPTLAGTTQIHNAWDIEGKVLGVAPAPGDYNSDGAVGIEDYEVWRSTFGQFAFPLLGADGNGNGVIDVGDYTVWRDNLASQSDATAAPEPAAALGCTLLPVGMTLRRKRALAV
ncbi:MAG: hypothetical protein AAGJ46_13395 [Planctomycetota bacterium]